MDMVHETGGISTVSDCHNGLSEQFRDDRAVMRSRENAYEAVKRAILRDVLPPRERLIEERSGVALGASGARACRGDPGALARSVCAVGRLTGRTPQLSSSRSVRS
jgi:hypothetical protein